MARGVIQLPLERGKQELTWYVGSAVVNGQNVTNPVVPLQVDRDADFVAKRLWLIQWPSTTDASLKLPPRSSAILRDGGTKRALSLVAGFNRALALDCDPAHATAAWLGLPSPFLIRNNSNLFAEVANPGAAATAWTGDLYIVAEGFKVYPNLPVDIPRTVESYAIPYALDTNLITLDPSAAPANIAAQIATITNNGEGKFLAKGLTVQAIDNAGADKTDALLRCLGIQVTDTTAGMKQWVRNPTAGQGIPHCPILIPTLHGAFLPFATPRLIDENGVVQIQLVFSNIAAALAYVSGAAAWPVTFTFSLYGALLPR